MTAAPLSEHQLHLLREVVRREAGICIKDEDVNRVVSRLLRMIKTEGLSSLNELLNALRESNKFLIQRTIEAVAINETSFFRDDKAVTLLCNDIIPRLIISDQQINIKIWCAGCSTGQEAYSIAIALFEKCADIIPRISIIASDVSPSVIAKAQIGLYTEFELRRGISDDLKFKYFNKTQSGWQVNSEIGQLIEFRISNINGGISSIPHNFDVVFLRNVMIYFDESTRAQLIKNIRQRINQDGYLFIGSSECALTQDSGFKKIRHDELQYYR